MIQALACDDGCGEGQRINRACRASRQNPCHKHIKKKKSERFGGVGGSAVLVASPARTRFGEPQVFYAPWCYSLVLPFSSRCSACFGSLPSIFSLNQSPTKSFCSNLITRAIVSDYLPDLTTPLTQCLDLQACFGDVMNRPRFGRELSREPCMKLIPTTS